MIWGAEPAQGQGMSRLAVFLGSAAAETEGPVEFELNWETLLDALERGDERSLSALRRTVSASEVEEASALLDALSMAAAIPDRALIDQTRARVLAELSPSRRERISRWLGARWAELLADSAQPSLAVRSGAQLDRHTLIYRVEDRTITVKISESPDDPESSACLRGSVLSDASRSTEGAVTVFGGGKFLDASELGTGAIGAGGAFRFDVPRTAPTYLEVRLAEETVLVGPIPPLAPA